MTIGSYSGWKTDLKNSSAKQILKQLLFDLALVLSNLHLNLFSNESNDLIFYPKFLLAKASGAKKMRKCTGSPSLH